ncbi:MAG: hypothetical protein ABIL78_05300 [candidate division WOR-3 bacterium]
MNQELAKDLITYLLGRSKDNLIAMLIDLLTMYINDKNSSTIREFITVALAGYTHEKGKIGYNGFKQDSIIPGKTIKCEAKPKNINTEDFEKYKLGERKTKPAKLNGGGNFTDYTLTRLERDKKENLNVLVSGFIDGRLIYIIEFPFNTPEFVNHLENQIKRWQAKLSGSQSTRGQFLRSAYFDYRHYINSTELKVVYLIPRVELEKYKEYISKGFYQFLWSKAR